MTVEYGNIFYFLFPMVAAAIFFGFYFLLKGRSRRFCYWFIFGLLAFNLAVHFTKLLFEPYRSNLPILYRKITPENICAVSTIVFPFIYLSKNKTLKDYMFYMGVLSGIAATFIPVEAIGFSPVYYDTIRFYVCHSILWIAPLLMTVYGLHTLDYRRIWKAPFVFFGVLGIIVVNEVIIFRVGLLDDKFQSLEDMFNPSIRNSSFIFGPTPGLEKAAVILTALCPKFLKFSPITGEAMYWPILWMVIPVLIYMPAIFLVFSLYWERDHMRADWIAFLDRVKYARALRRAKKEGTTLPPPVLRDRDAPRNEPEPAATEPDADPAAVGAGKHE